MQEISAEVAQDAATILVCAHPVLEYLGGGGSAIYRRCRDCAKIVVVYGGRIWTIGPETAPLAERSSPRS